MGLEQNIDKIVVIGGIALAAAGLLWIVTYQDIKPPQRIIMIPDIALNKEDCEDNLFDAYTLRLRVLWKQMDALFPEIKIADTQEEIVTVKDKLEKAVEKYKTQYVPNIFSQFHEEEVKGYETLIDALDARMHGDMNMFNRKIDESTEYLGQATAIMIKITEVCGLNPNMRTVFIANE